MSVDLTPQKYGEEFVVNTQNSADQKNPSLTSLIDGKFVSVWEDDSQVYGDGSGPSIKVQLFDLAGVKIGTEFLVNTYTAYDQARPAVTALTNGGFVVTWADGSGTLGDTSGSIKAQLFNASGNKVGVEFLVNTHTPGDQGVPATAGLANGGFVVAWQDGNLGVSGISALGDLSGSSIAARIFNAVGEQIGSDFLVNTNTSGNQFAPKLAKIWGGGFVLVWADNSGTLGDEFDSSIKGQLYKENGERIGAEFLINTEFYARQDAPSVAALSNGDFVVTWHDTSGILGDSDENIKAQMFNASGSKVGSEFTVNAQLNGAQDSPVVIALANGDFVISWQDGGASSSDQGDDSVRAQLFSSSGIMIGTEFLVSALGMKGNFAPSATALAEGNFAVSWQIPGASDFEVACQIFTLPVSLTGSVNADNLVGGTGADSINGGAGVDTLDGGTGNDSVTGGTGIDRFVIGAGIDSITDLGAGGADVVVVSAGATANARLAAAWTATADSSNDGTANLTANGYSVNLAAVSGGAGWTVSNAGRATAVELTGSANADRLVGGTGADTLDGGTGNDSLNGGYGTDRFVIGAGTDRITDLGSGGADAVVVSAGATANARLAAAWTATADSSNDGTANLTTNGYSVNLAAVSGGAGWTVSNAGRATAVALTGSANADGLVGGNGDDRLVGGSGLDRLTGGSGADAFVFSARTDVGDKVTDFVSGVDHVEISAAAFGGGLTSGMDLAAAGHFAVNVSGNATAAFGQFIYESDAGRLWWDADGSGASTHVVVATLSGAPSLAASDIWLV